LKLLLDPFLARLYGDDGGVTPQHPVHNLNYNKHLQTQTTAVPIRPSEIKEYFAQKSTKTANGKKSANYIVFTLFPRFKELMFSLDGWTLTLELGNCTGIKILMQQNLLLVIINGVWVRIQQKAGPEYGCF